MDSPKGIAANLKASGFRRGTIWEMSLDFFFFFKACEEPASLRVFHLTRAGCIILGPVNCGGENRLRYELPSLLVPLGVGLGKWDHELL